ncbi:2-amino-4-hydroxy-6-hydroxymethyldihydropteridine diphosphokinase [Sphingopyxis sp.]|uniref:2-amino-4-hydroxy-6- hydroxymethyldihydropteridine diphosphokinase n=1 Tax=Sphingopyxis sp. TaxID=1908224 RepID=UPI003BAC895A
MTSATPLPLYAIGLGSNRRHARFGDPRQVLLAALDALESDDIEPVDVSPIIASEPIGPSRRRYANAVALVASPLTPPEMLARLQAVEAEFGRRIGQRWGARTLDLDILLWSGGAWSDAELTIPHAELAGRAFVLGPLRAIAPDWRHPLSARTIRQLAARLIRPKPVDRNAEAH